MPSALIQPRAEPGHLLPALAGGRRLLLALPVFLVADWRSAAGRSRPSSTRPCHVLDYVIASVRRG